MRGAARGLRQHRASEITSRNYDQRTGTICDVAHLTGRQPCASVPSARNRTMCQQGRWVPGVKVDRYPTWPFYRRLCCRCSGRCPALHTAGPRSEPRSTYLKILLAWLLVPRLAALGLIFTRTGQRIAPNEGLLVFTDLMASLTVIAIPICRATGRLTVSELRQIRGPTALTDMFGPGGASRRVPGRTRPRGLPARNDRPRRSWQPIPVPPRVREPRRA